MQIRSTPGVERPAELQSHDCSKGNVLERLICNFECVSIDINHRFILCHVFDFVVLLVNNQLKPQARVINRRFLRTPYIV